MPDTKMIVVKSRGLVHTSRGLIQSPIVSAYRESVDKIWEMLTRDRADVYEVLRNKKEIQLNVQNFDADNNALIKEAPVTSTAQKPFTGVETSQQTPAVENKQESDVVDKTAETQNQSGFSGGNNQQQKNQQNTWKNQNNKGNKNKHGNKDNNGQRQPQNQSASGEKKDTNAESNPSVVTEKTSEKNQVEADATTQTPAGENKQESDVVDKAAESAALAVEPEEI